MKHLLQMLLAYRRARSLKFSTREALEQHQARELQKFLPTLCERSRYFSAFKGLPLTQWPLMDKAHMIEHFDEMNTAGLSFEQALDVAMLAEKQRDFRPTIKGITIGMSSGTSGRRAVFAVDAKEKAAWAGIMLAKALPDGLFAKERVAFFLRANSNLYMGVRNRRLAFTFFDLFHPFDQLIDRLAEHRPTIIVAPAQVLRQLALARLSGRLQTSPKRVISVAEVLDAQDRIIIEKAFGTPHEIYQATEGFLASTCEHGVLHLNEEYIHVEPQWLDAAQRRFTPVITDFSRLTQPIVRYHLNDILLARAAPCPCGSAARALDYIEGRYDDMLILPGPGGSTIPVFSDVLSRALARALPAESDYRLVQEGPASLRLYAPVDMESLTGVRAQLEHTLENLGVCLRRLDWRVQNSMPAFDPAKKRRRIMREAGVAPCA